MTKAVKQWRRAIRTAPAQWRHGRLCTAVALLAGVLSAIISTSAAAAAADITTFAGGGPCAPDDYACLYDGSSTGDGGPATAAHLNKPYGLAVAAGSTFISENRGDRVRKVAADGTISLVAGGGTPPNGDGGPATDALLSNAQNVAADQAGNLFMTDSKPDNSGVLIRKVNHATKAITTVAELTGYVSGLAVDGIGNLYVSDGQNAVLKVNPDGSVTTVAGSRCPSGTYCPGGFGGDGGPATAAQLNGTRGITIDPSGNLYVDDVSNYRVRKVTPGADRVLNGASDEIITTAAGNGIQPPYDGTPATSGDGGPATAAGIGYAEGAGVDAGGNLLIAAFGPTASDYRIRRVDHATGIITTLAGGGSPSSGVGDGGPATAARLQISLGVTADAAGNVVIAETGGQRLRKVDPAGTITTLAGDASCTDYCPDGFSGDGGPATSAGLSSPIGLALAAGRVVVADSGNHRLRQLDGAGVISTVAGGGVGDGLAATATFVHGPQGLAADAAGSVLIADCDDARVRKVDGSGVITTVAGGGTGAAGRGDGLAATSDVLGCPAGLAVATAGTAIPAGTLLIADCQDNKVRKVDPATGVISTVAGTGAAGFSGDATQATRAKLRCPSDLALDAAGNLLIADTGNNRVRRVDAATGKISTVAGDGTIGFGSEGAVATKTPLTQPSGLTVDPAGDLVVTDRYARVRKVDAVTARMTTVAGSGVPGFSGDGGPATLAQMVNPTQVRFDGAGNLLVTDRGNNRVRRVEAGTPPPPPPPPTSGCGQVITRNTTLTSDIGPCAHDGIVVGADGITVNLNGHRIVGLVSSDGTGADGSSVGIRLANRTGVTVKGATSPGSGQGSVSGFNAGVAIVGGSKNTVANLTVRDNTGSLGQNTSEFGDGIAVLFSSANTLKANVVAHNGPYDGIGVLGKGSDNNTLSGNTITDTFTYPDGYGCDGTGEGIIMTPFLDISLPRGVTISGNKVVGNTVARNDTAGISTISDVGATIQNNTVLDNGTFVTVSDPVYGDYSFWRCPGVGIGLQRLFFTTSVTEDLVQGNTVHGSGSDGIQVLNTNKNRVLGNVSTGNGLDGYGLDLDDMSNYYSGYKGLYPGPDCTDNVWSANTWGSAGYYPDCTANGGTGPNPPTASRHSSPHAVNPRAQAPERSGAEAPKRHLSPGILAQAKA